MPNNSYRSADVQPDREEQSHADRAHPELGDRNILRVEDLSKAEYESLFQLTDDIRRGGWDTQLLSHFSGRQMVTAFFEPSTRTRLSFESSMLRLGGTSHGFTDIRESRMSGISSESLADTGRMLGMYGDVIVARHPRAGAVDTLAAYAGVPTINAGDGTGEHPTQAMIDVYTLRNLLGSLSGLPLLILNDIRMRCARSLIKVARIFDCEIHLLAEQVAQLHTAEGLPDLIYRDAIVHDTAREALAAVDAVYVSPTVHKIDGHDVDVNDTARLLLSSLGAGRRPNSPLVLHPLPRGAEIPIEFDDQPQAAYFTQAANGVPLRMALLIKILGGGLHQPLTHSQTHRTPPVQSDYELGA